MDLAVEVPELAARSGDVARGVEGDLRPAGRPDRVAPHHADHGQHAPAGRAHGAPAVGAARRRARRRAPRQPGEGSATRGGGKADSEGKLKVLVATASLELGIDIGHVDLVCQISSPHRIATFLQRVGRSGHTIKGVPKGRIFPLTRDDLIECAAMVRAVHDGELDRVERARQAARRARAADRRRDFGGRGMGRGGAVRPRSGAPIRIATSERDEFDGSRRDARPRLRDAARPARGADPPRQL